MWEAKSNAQIFRRARAFINDAGAKDLVFEPMDSVRRAIDCYVNTLSHVFVHIVVWCLSLVSSDAEDLMNFQGVDHHAEP